MGEGASFSCKCKGGMVLVYREIAYALMFYGKKVLFSGGMATTINILYSEVSFCATSKILKIYWSEVMEQLRKKYEAVVFQ